MNKQQVVTRCVRGNKNSQVGTWQRKWNDLIERRNLKWRSTENTEKEGLRVKFKSDRCQGSGEDSVGWTGALCHFFIYSNLTALRITSQSSVLNVGSVFRRSWQWYCFLRFRKTRQLRLGNPLATSFIWRHRGVVVVRFTCKPLITRRSRRGECNVWRDAMFCDVFTQHASGVPYKSESHLKVEKKHWRENSYEKHYNFHVDHAKSESRNALEFCTLRIKVRLPVNSWNSLK